MSQAISLGWDEPALSRLRDGYDVAERIFSGFYRAQGMPFICHLVRTASIVLAERQSPHVVLASLLHAVYMLHTFDNRRYRGADASCRATMRKRLGDDVETLIWTYDHLPWFSQEAIDRHLEGAAEWPTLTRQVLVMRLANELEDYLDLAMAYRGSYPFRERLDSYGAGMVELARRLGHIRLATMLQRAFDSQMACQLPPAALRQRRNAYTLPPGPWRRKTLLQRARTESKRLAQPLLNGFKA